MRLLISLYSCSRPKRTTSTVQVKASDLAITVTCPDSSLVDRTALEDPAIDEATRDAGGYPGRGRHLVDNSETWRHANSLCALSVSH